MREPIANKTHYPNGVTLLDNTFHELFSEHPKGPGSLPLKHESNTLKGVIVPHGSYQLAGPAMAWAYQALASSAVNDKLFFIIGQSQFSTGQGVTGETFLTPYGEVRADQHIIRELVAKGSIPYNDDIHLQENLIEVQLPFLQFISSAKEKIKIVPLLVNHETDMKTLALDIKETLVDQGKEATFIFVTNFTSYGRNFSYVPFTENIPDNIAAFDKKVLDAICAYDQEQFVQALEETLIPLSGQAPLELFFQLFHDPKISLEQYYLSGDINDNYTTTVSYASLRIE